MEDWGEWQEGKGRICRYGVRVWALMHVSSLWLKLGKLPQTHLHQVVRHVGYYLGHFPAFFFCSQSPMKQSAPGEENTNTAQAWKLNLGLIFQDKHGTNYFVHVVHIRLTGK